jgi:hypothetical protein
MSWRGSEADDQAQKRQLRCGAVASPRLVAMEAQQEAWAG